MSTSTKKKSTPTQAKANGKNGAVDPQHLHDVYSFLLKQLELTPDHVKKLQARGLTDPEIIKLGYKSWPTSHRALADKMQRQFGDKLKGVPGFWKDHNGWQVTGKDGIAIPVRNRLGQIVGIKIRVDRPAKSSAKYILLSSNPKPDKDTGRSQYPQGTKAKVSIHWPLGRPKKIKALRITEGELKADICVNLTDEYTISLPGVNLWRMALEAVEQIKPPLVLLAFDSDKDKAQQGNYRDQETGEPLEPFVVGKSLASLYLTLKDKGIAIAIEHWPEDAGKGIDDVILNGCQDQITRLQGDEAEAWAKDKLAEGLPKGWVYVVGVKRFFHTETLVAIDKEQFNDQFRRDYAKGTPSTIVLANTATPLLDAPIYMPSQPATYVEGCIKYFNTWRPPTNIVARKGKGVKWFLDHTAYIIPDERERNIFLDWLAYNIRFPGNKIQWAMLIQGAQGVGKSYFGKGLMAGLLGTDNISWPTNDEIKGERNAWAKHCSLVVINELMARGRLDIANKLKDLITEPYVTINEKYIPEYRQPNVFNFLIFTNYKDAIPLSNDDRRFCIIYSPAIKKDDASYYDELFGRTADNLPALRYWFEQRDLSNFRPHAHAPKTTSKDALIRDSRPPLRAWMEDRIAERQHPFEQDLLCVSELSQYLPNDLKHKATDQALGKMLNELNCYSLGQVPVENKHLRLWAVRNGEDWAKALVERNGYLAAQYLQHKSQRYDTNPV